MEALHNYLESSTIHGLYYIGAAKSQVTRLFWIIIVLSSFFVAAILVESSFSSWKESPFISTSTTLLISNAKFPIVTVCPPEESNTVLNADIIGVEKIDLNKTIQLHVNLNHYS